MSSIVITDPSLAAQFRFSTPEAQVVDASGRVIGRFIPEEPLPQPPYDGIKSPYTVEQLDAFEKEEGGKSLAEIWQSLGRK